MMMRWMKILLLGLMFLSVVACSEERQTRLSSPFDFSNTDIEEVRAAAEDGVAQAQYELGMRYADGEKGAYLDYEIAASWFSKAAEQGHVQAQRELGACYHFGNGEQAVYWYRKAAEQGDAEAQFNLGTCYVDGNGVPQDYEQAVYWYRKAAGQGYAKAKAALKELGY